jgi:hypothetical protein
LWREPIGRGEDPGDAADFQERHSRPDTGVRTDRIRSRAANPPILTGRGKSWPARRAAPPSEVRTCRSSVGCVVSSRISCSVVCAGNAQGGVAWLSARIFTANQAATPTWKVTPPIVAAPPALRWVMVATIMHEPGSVRGVKVRAAHLAAQRRQVLTEREVLGHLARPRLERGQQRPDHGRDDREHSPDLRPARGAARVGP